MPSSRLYLCYGGGIGDVSYDFRHDPNAQFIKSLVEEWDAEIRIYTLCHNIGVMDLFKNHPHIHSHINQDWHPPNQDDIIRFNRPIDNFLPLHVDAYRYSLCGPNCGRSQPRLYLSKQEEQDLADLLVQRPCVVIQPFAGLSDRDAFDSKSLRSLVCHMAEIDPKVRIVIVGYNHERAHKYTREEVGFDHPNVVDLIDKAGICFCHFLVKGCDAFCGAHSNLIRDAWEYRKRNSCVMPEPLMTDHIGNLDAKYRFGFSYPESKTFTYHFEQGGPREFNTLNTETLALHLLGR